jgi:hypothetical protein
VAFFFASITSALALDPSSRPAAYFFAPFLALALFRLGLAASTAPHLMTMHAADDRIEFLLPRWPSRRERAIRLVIEAAARHQGRPGPLPGPPEGA